MRALSCSERCSPGPEGLRFLLSVLSLCFSPSGKKFRSKPQLARYLGSSMDLSTFDFRTGKMLMNKMNKNRQRMRYDCSNQAKVRASCSGSSPLPVRCCTGQQLLWASVAAEPAVVSGGL